MRPERCKGEAENMKVQSPKISKQEEIILPVLEMSFRILSDLLMKNPSSDWKSSDLHVLQQLLGHQRQFYATCYPVASSTHAEVEKWSAFWSNLTDYLTEKGEETAERHCCAALSQRERCYNCKVQGHPPRRVSTGKPPRHSRERCDTCEWMISQYRMKNGVCLSLLREMGGEITTFNKPVSFPHLVYNAVERAKAEDQMSFLAEATEQIIVLFDAASNADNINWDSRALDDFLNILNTRQLMELKKCTATYAERTRHSNSERKIRRHFKRLKKMLKNANYSPDALEQIRNTVQLHLMRMDIIGADVRQKLMKRTN
ncbi:interferon phi 1 precursor [Silurus meridionalis]|nr:interferon phi 1 precursor [Silurus meridionalis]